jgi:ribonucleoside-diphosphate reductase alpha chain
MAFKLEGLADEIWNKKYKDTEDKSVEDMWMRVATAIASVEKPEDRVQWVNAFYELLYGFKQIPGGRINAGAGTKNNFLLNCAALPIEDSIDGIYEAIKKAAVLAKCQYGSGFSFSSIRPKDDDVSRGGSASGPVSFMRVFDASGAIIETGGNRRAAAIGVLRVDHPDIFEFIDAKRQEGVLTQFNISVALTDKFLEAVRTDADFDLVFGGRTYKTVKAKSIWEKLVYSGYNFNDPGILMIDEVNKYNNGYYLYEIETTNPCGLR